MKRMLILLSIALFTGRLACQFAYAQLNTVLQDNDIAGIIIESTTMRHWCTRIDDKNMPVATEGVGQRAVIQGLNVSILYAEFDNTNRAHQAAEFYSKNHASIFYPGLWDGAQNVSIGDESWYSSDPGGNAILFRSGRTCVLAGCVGKGDKEKQNQVAELLAKPIEDKVKAGGQVILPYDEQSGILKAQVTLKPEALNVSPGILTAFVRLPTGYPVSGITTATCDRARYERMMLNEDATEMIIKFRRQDIEAALAQIGESIDINFVVRGVWHGDVRTYRFHGVDSIAKIVGTNLSRSGRE